MKIKLIRNKIPEIMNEKDRNNHVLNVSHDMHVKLLSEKLIEEAREVVAELHEYPKIRNKQAMEELADLFTAYQDLIKLLEIDENGLEKCIINKIKKRGDFSEPIAYIIKE